jgi:hypothetical protein
VLNVIAGHPSHISLLRRDRLEAMGKDLIQLCDQLEQHGLVDYQMGIWEEEILSGIVHHYHLHHFISNQVHLYSPRPMPRSDG